MNAETIKGKALSYILMRPNRFRPNVSYPLVILLHESGKSMYDLTGIASGMEDRGYVYAVPNGPYRLRSAFGWAGYSWFQPAQGMDQNGAETMELEALLDGFVAETQEQIAAEPGKIAIIGFGDAAAVALRFGLERPQTFRGVAGLAEPGDALGDAADIGARLPSERSQALFLAQTSAGPEQIEQGLNVKHVLEAAGYPLVFREYEAPRPQTLGEGEPNEEEDYAVDAVAPHLWLQEMTTWLKEALPPN